MLMLSAAPLKLCIRLNSQFLQACCKGAANFKATLPSKADDTLTTRAKERQRKASCPCLAVNGDERISVLGCNEFRDSSSESIIEARGVCLSVGHGAPLGPSSTNCFGRQVFTILWSLQKFSSRRVSPARLGHLTSPCIEPAWTVWTPAVAGAYARLLL